MREQIGGANPTLDSLVGCDVAAYVQEWDCGIRAGLMGRKFGMTTQQARHLLDRCVRAGLLERDPRYSSYNCAAWRVPARDPSTV